ncbi:hypothetical protein BKA80DRAFT_254643 [Phyllosticta citrichinensis]
MAQCFAVSSTQAQGAANKHSLPDWAAGRLASRYSRRYGRAAAGTSQAASAQRAETGISKFSHSTLPGIGHSHFPPRLFAGVKTITVTRTNQDQTLRSITATECTYVLDFSPSKQTTRQLPQTPTCLHTKICFARANNLWSTWRPSQTVRRTQSYSSTTIGSRAISLLLLLLLPPRSPAGCCRCYRDDDLPYVVACM